MRDRVMGVICASLAVMFLTCNMENNSRVGRVVSTGLVVALSLWSLHVGWLGGRHLRRFLPPVLAVLGALLLSTAFSIDPSYSLRTLLRQHLWYILLLVAAGAWCSVPRHQVWFLRGLGAAVGIASAAGVFLYHFAPDLERLGYIAQSSEYVYTAQDSEGRVYRRAAGLMESYTRSAMVHILAMPAIVALMVHCWRARRRAELAAWAVALAVSALYLLLTKARGAWLATAGACFLTMVLLRCRWWVLCAVPAVALLALAVLPSERARALTLVSHLSDPNLVLSGRLDLWNQGYRPVADHPLVGIGYGGNIFLTKEGIARYELHSADRRQPDLHNIYFQTLAEVGILGIAAYAWLLMVTIRAGIRSIRREWKDPQYLGAAPALAGLAAMMVVGVVYYMNEDHVAQIWWTTMGLIVGAGARRRERATPPA